MSDKATPRPWRIGKRNPDPLYPDEIAVVADLPAGIEVGPRAHKTRAAGEFCVACVSPVGHRPDTYPELTESNAALIVRAVNNFDALLAALVRAEDMLVVSMTRDLDFSRATREEIIARHPGMAAIRAAIAAATP